MINKRVISTFVMVLVLISSISLISAINLLVSSEPIVSSIINDEDKPGVIDFTITNNGKIAVFELYTFERFDEIFELTEKTDLSVKKSIIIAIRIALDESIHVESFKKIFNLLISPDGPDLPFQEAMDYAEKFAQKGKYTYALIDEIYSFCQSRKEIAYTKLKCVELGAEVVDLGITKNTIFKEAYLFFLNHKYLNFNSKESLEKTLLLLKYGPDSFDDFKEIFNFALKKSGINVSQKEALEIALTVLEKAELTSKAKKELEKGSKVNEEKSK